MSSTELRKMPIKLSHSPIGIIRPIVLVMLSIGLFACTDNSGPVIANDKAVATESGSTIDKIPQLQREADNGDPDAQYDLAYRYENGLGVPKDEVKALELYEKAAFQGHAAAKNNLDAIKNH
jgi:TPR repeat protein